ncbi:Hpt domain-containing protein [Pseudodesulfovibrio sp. F-1]|uniref:Hpt domain-containing protein n=1 Tax=Pseudodesulfovibrio alkaliphilus TaxID=2661613 RepID=A0A7K1KKW4_9BACT|nr:Hpt domain-containing protein [Pseudodesulfovibrio alkaliphilus]MUM76719.1 Hpt domain-containing protein [Pseudodesulfovibrio alkaliphilus]
MKPFTVTVDADLAAIMPRYFELQRADLAAVARAAAAGRAEPVRLFGHRLKGTGASYGFPRLTELGAGIEEAALADDLGRAAELAAEVGRFLDAVRVVYASHGPDSGHDPSGGGR